MAADKGGFSSQKDYFNFASGKVGVVKSSSGFAQKVATTTDDNGDTNVRMAYGKSEAPSCEYKIITDLAGSDFPALGTVTPQANDLKLPTMLTEISISTGAGTEPTVSLSGVGVEPGATTKRSFALTSIGAVVPIYKSQILGGAAVVTGGDVTAATLKASCSFDVQEITGEPVGSHVWDGKLEVGLTIISETGTAPTVQPGEGWVITAGPVQSDTDDDFQSWEVTLVKSLPVTEPAA